MGEIEYTERVVAFIDILGFKGIINKSIEDENKFLQIMCTLSYFQDEAEKIKNVGAKEWKKDICHGKQLTAFSDNIVISYPLNKITMIHLIKEVISLQCSFGAFGFITRGGISFGKLYHEHSIVFGPAFHRAYELETQVANYPRVILDSQYLHKYHGLFEDSETPLSEDVNELLKKADDGFYFLDFVSKCDGSTTEKLLRIVKETIKEIKDEGNNQRHLSKLNWLSNYLNNKLD
ncbi:MAG: hypothetical protein PHO01_07310 [Desulfotomaculaceae bacterium]|nr:hypothetical protein [Desulfotomaculaceae bacterium]